MIVLTAKSEAEAKERVLAAGAHAVFEKTAEKQELLAGIECLLGGGAPRPA